VLHGEDDLQPESASREYLAALSQARCEVIGGAHHFPQIEAPDQFASAVRAFLERAGPAASMYHGRMRPNTARNLWMARG